MKTSELRQISKLLVTKSMGNAAKLYKLYNLQDKYIELKNYSDASSVQNYIDMLTAPVRRKHANSYK